MRLLVRVLAVLLAAAFLAGCGGGSSSELSCAVGDSDYGPLGVQLGMSDEAAEAFMIDQGIDAWVEVTADGDWAPLWDTALDELGGVIHTDLTWIDVGVALTDSAGGDLAVVPVRVSRSYQGKIESAKNGAFEPLAAGVEASGCRVESIVLGDADHPTWLEFSISGPDDSVAAG